MREHQLHVLVSRMSFMEPELTVCRKPDCLRKIKSTVAYCCEACWRADKGGYEIHESGVLGHGDVCNRRSGERGEWSWAEAEALKAQLP